MLFPQMAKSLDRVLGLPVSSCVSGCDCDQDPYPGLVRHSPVSVVDYSQDREEGLLWGECSEAQAGVAPGRAWGPRGVGEGNPRVSAVDLGVSPKPSSDFALP